MEEVVVTLLLPLTVELAVAVVQVLEVTIQMVQEQMQVLLTGDLAVVVVVELNVLVVEMDLVV